jgi:hypothetical protein
MKNQTIYYTNNSKGGIVSGARDMGGEKPRHVSNSHNMIKWYFFHPLDEH